MLATYEDTVLLRAGLLTFNLELPLPLETLDWFRLCAEFERLLEREGAVGVDGALEMVPAGDEEDGLCVPFDWSGFCRYRH